jgi:ectoine hydroxylase-related dioxygenase (phytanoyl-CoA dioxygenase family)
LLHLDSQIHRFQFTVNFWVPFQDCGIDAPSLQVVPLDYIRTRDYSGFTGRRLRKQESFQYSYFRKGAFSPSAVRAAFGKNCFLPATLKAGDLVIASNWLIHGSYRTPAMTKGRTSIELRFIGTDLDIAPHLKPLAHRVLSAALGRASKNFARAPHAWMG